MSILSSLKHSITRKLLTYVFSIYLIVTFTVTMAHMYFEYSNADHRIKVELGLYENIISPVLAEALWNYDENQVQKTINGLTRSQSVIGAKVVSSGKEKLSWHANFSVVDEENQIVKYYDPLSGEMQDKKNTPAYAKIFTHKFDVSYLEVDGTRTKVGEAFIYSSSDAVFQEVKMGFVLIFANAIFKTFSLWVFFLGFGYVYLTKPLLRLTDATLEVKKGNLDLEKMPYDHIWPTEIDELGINFGSMVDDLKSTREQLSSSQMRISEIINSMPSMIIGIQENGIITDWNKQAEIVTNTPLADAIGKKIDKVYPPFSGYIDQVGLALKSMTAQSIPNVIVYQGDEKHYYDVAIYPIVTNKHRGAVMRIDDVTTRIQMESMMVQTEKMSSVGSLAAGMAHEINNPLGAILQGAQNVVRRLDPEVPANKVVADELKLDLKLVNQYFDKRKVNRFMEGIKEAGERAAKIVANLLQFSRKSNANKAACSLEDIVQRSIELARTDYDLKKKTDFKRVEISTHYADFLPQVHACQMEIEQVILNLLKNAGQAMKDSQKSPKINIKMYQQDQMVVLEVEDNGPGMPEHVRRRVFEPFFTTKPVGEGTGLGLSVSYGIIVESHRGDLAVESQEGIGTKFTIKLPVAHREQ